jgi:hypothetical protein
MGLANQLHCLAHQHRTVTHMLLRPRLFWIGCPLLVLLTVADQWEWHARKERQLREAAASVVVVAAEGDSFGAHSSVGVVEKNTEAGAFTFATLGTWDYEQTSHAVCPPTIQAHDGKRRRLAGFMYPLGDGPRVTSFCLLRTTQTCCFGPRPQFNQYLLVECDQPFDFERLRPVIVEGDFHIDPQPTQGFIYRMDHASVSEAGGDGTPSDPRAYAAANHLDWWDWGLLTKAEKDSDALAALRRQDGAQAVAAGTVLLRDPGPPPQFLLAHDGAESSAGMFGSIIVVPRADATMPQSWDSTVAWQGTLHVNERDQWPERGVVRLEQARPCTAAGAALDAGPFLGWWGSGILLAALLLVAVGRKPDDTVPTAPAAG